MEIFRKLNPDNKVSIIKFEKTTLNLSELSTKSISEPKIQETTTAKLFKCLHK